MNRTRGGWGRVEGKGEWRVAMGEETVHFA